MSLGTLLTSQLVVAGMDSFRGTRSSYDILREAQRALGSTGNLRAPDVPFYQIHMHEQTAPFYLGRTTTPVEFRDELAPGIDAEPGKAFSTVAEWRPTWDALPQGYALVPVSDFDVLAADGIPMRVLARDTRRVVVSRR